MPSVFMSKNNSGHLPNLIIIGAQKCATSALHYYLGLHPQIFMSKQKELDFFIGERSWGKGISWYKSHFTGTFKIYGEASPNYTVHPLYKEVPARMYSLVPEAKLIYLVRDPLERIVSHYVHRLASGKEKRKFEELFVDINSAEVYLARSRYCEQIEQFLKYFPKKNILILNQEDLLLNRDSTMKTVFRFLCVEENFSSRRFSIMPHRSDEKREKNSIGEKLSKNSLINNFIERSPPNMRWRVKRSVYYPFSQPIKRPVLSKEQVRFLTDALLDDITRFRKLTGHDFSSWSL
ncbi:MAG TPA: sulfotransferase [Euryarchaeota archaeon]|nr:sulfotransferase [Euryarchaeota archaeon]